MPRANHSLRGNTFLCVASALLLSACSTTKDAAVLKPVAAAITEVAAGDADQHISIVRAARMPGYNAVAIGKAFEAAFPDSRWSSAETNGVWQVEFIGTLPRRIYEECVAASQTTRTEPCSENERVTFQWAFAPDGQSFGLSYIDQRPWPSRLRSTRRVLAFIYE